MNRSSSAALIRRSVVIGAAVCVGALAFSCSPAGTDSKVTGGPDAPATSPSGGAGPGNPGSAGTAGSITIGGEIIKETPEGPCMGLECQVPACTGSPTTSISGKVYDPAGKMPLYNVMVYVPNGPVPAFTEGISCDRCGASITNPVTAAITDEAGAFKLDRAPAGADIPLVIQVGKWRRQIKIPNVAPCVDTALTDPQVTRLPRTKAEGDIPRIAIAAGGADAMECFPRRLGIADSEFTTSAGDGRIHLYTATDAGADLSVKAFDTTLNAGAALPHSMQLWSNLEALKKYDIVVLSCEGAELGMEKTPASRQALYDYVSQGGRVFASHWANVWFSDGPPAVQSVGNWNNRDNPVASGTLPATIDQSFPKGQALARWLVNVGASTMLGTLMVTMPRDNIQTVDPLLAREWITVQNPKYAGAEKSIQYMSFNAPVGAPEAEVCGRAVFTGLHVSTDVEDETVQPPGFPVSCAQTELSPEEKAVAFMLFDLSACVQNDKDPPQVPK